MARPYAGAGGTHMALGLLCMFAGVAWICLLYFYDDLKITNTLGKKVSLLTVYPEWVSVLLSAKIYCGFWFFLTGAIACCIKSRGCTEGVFVALSVLNVIIWAPALLFLTVMMGYTIIFGALIKLDGQDLGELEDVFTKYAWLWTFPAIGLLVGVVEFILSIVSYSIVCCCRPSALREGYEYQYEMK